VGSSLVWAFFPPFSGWKRFSAKVPETPKLKEFMYMRLSCRFWAVVWARLFMAVAMAGSP